MDTIDNTLAPKHAVLKLGTTAIPVSGSVAVSLWSCLSATDQASLAGSGILQVEVLSPTVAINLQSASPITAGQWPVPAGAQERIPLTGATDATLNSIFAVSQTGGTVTDAVIRVFYRAPN